MLGLTEEYIGAHTGARLQELRLELLRLALLLGRHMLEDLPQPTRLRRMLEDLLQPTRLRRMLEDLPQPTRLGLRLPQEGQVMATAQGLTRTL